MQCPRCKRKNVGILVSISCFHKSGRVCLSPCYGEIETEYYRKLKEEKIKE